MAVTDRWLNNEVGSVHTNLDTKPHASHDKHVVSDRKGLCKYEEGNDDVMIAADAVKQRCTSNYSLKLSAKHSPP